MVANKTVQKKAKSLKLKRIFRMGSGMFIYSIVPILSWIVLGLIKGDPRIENVFAITYPMGFCWAILISLFGTAANIRAHKEQNANHIYNSAFWGIIFSVIIFVIPTVFVDNYIVFFGQDPQVYREYVMYAFLLTILQVVFSFIVEKLYFEDREKTANRHILAFNVINFVVLVLTSLIFSNFIISMVITLAVMLVYVVVLYVFEFKKFKIDFSVFKNFTYESANIVSSALMFVIYFFGLKNAFTAGEEYVLALTTVSLCTDAFWDSMVAISKIAKIDIAKKRFDYKNELKNSFVYTVVIVLISAAMTTGLAFLNGAKIEIVLIYFAFQLITLLLEPFMSLVSTYTQLEYSPVLNTVLTFVGRGIRVVLSVFILSPFCTEIGQITQSVLLFISFMILRLVKYKVMDGKLTIKEKAKVNQDNAVAEENNIIKTIDNGDK